MPNMDRLIGLYNSHVKFHRICSLSFVIEHLYSYLEPQLTNSTNVCLIFQGIYQTKTVDLVLLFYLYVATQ